MLDEIRKLKTTTIRVDWDVIEGYIEKDVVFLSDIEEIFAETKCSNCKRWQGSLPTTLLARCSLLTIIVKRDFYCKRIERLK